MGPIEKCNDLNRNRTHGLPACNTVLYPVTTHRATIYKDKADLATVSGSLWSGETSRLIRFIDNLDSQMAVRMLSLMRRPPFTPRNILGTQFC
jgi:hypothetical protein